MCISPPDAQPLNSITRQEITRVRAIDYGIEAHLFCSSPLVARDGEVIIFPNDPNYLKPFVRTERARRSRIAPGGRPCLTELYAK